MPDEVKESTSSWLSLRSLRLAGWLAWRRARSAPGELVLRAVIGIVIGLLLLSASALAPTSLNVAGRQANAGPIGVPLTAQQEGVRFDVVRGYFEERDVRVLRVAHVGVEAGSRYAGLSLPGEGEMLVSPAAQQLIAESGVFAGRYGGRIVGQVPLSHVPGPQSLTLWVGVPESEVDPDSGWLVDGRGYDGLRSQVPDTVAAGFVVVIVGLVMPLLALSVIVASVGSRRREERASALKLIGFSRRDVALSGVIEDVAIVTVSLGLGVAAFWLIVPRLSAQLPFDGGVWPVDVAVHVGGAVLLGVAVVVMSAALTWIRLGRATGARGDARARSVPTGLGWAMLVIATALLVGSQLPGVPALISSPLILAAMPLGMMAIISLLPWLITQLSAVLVRGGVAANWAGRVIQNDAVRVSRSSMGIVMLLVSGSVMLVFFPLMSTLNSASESVLGEQVGMNTLIGQGQDSETAQTQWDQVRKDYDSSVLIQWHQSQTGELINVFVVDDCARLATVAGIPEAKCESGLLAGEAGARIQGGDSIRLSEDTQPFQVPASAVPDSAATALLWNYSEDGGLLVSREQLPDLNPPRNLYMVSTGQGEMERARTRLEQSLGAPALTPLEMYQISTYSTRQFTILLWGVLGLMLAVASLSTFLTALDRVTTTRPERRLLAISGADPALWRSALQMQAMTPVLVGVTSATALGLIVSSGFVRLYNTEGGLAYVPTGGMLTLAGITVVISYAAVVISARLEPRHVLHETPE